MLLVTYIHTRVVPPEGLVHHRALLGHDARGHGEQRGPERCDVSLRPIFELVL